MTCSCCGRKKKLFDMFYSVGEDGNRFDVCSDCREVIERLESDAAGGERELLGIHLLQLKKRAKNPTEAFLSWQNAHFKE